MKTLRLIYRGCGTLPYVGAHPGTATILAFIVIGIIAGGWYGALISAVWLPFYLYGAYERALYSDRRFQEELDKSTKT